MPVPRQLPAAVRDFIGRTVELGKLQEVLSAGAPPLVVVEGMGGVGKTSLVVRWAHTAAEHFPHGTLFVDLRGYGPSTPLTAQVVLVGFVQALGVPISRMPGELDAIIGLYRSLLADRRVLVVLDNAVSADQVRPLLPGVGGSAVLVTSRGALPGLAATEGARSLLVEALPLDESVALARQVIGDVRADAESDALTRLVSLCGGLPLALRVATGRVARRRHRPISDLITELEDDRRRVEGLSAVGDDRSAVEAVFDASYRRLPGAQARVFRLLGLHPGPEFSVSTAAELTNLSTSNVFDVLEALADAHLVEPRASSRYRMHDLLRSYAATRVDPNEQTEAVPRLVNWYARAADAADRALFPKTSPIAVEPLPTVSGVPDFDRPSAMAWMDTEYPVLDAVLRLAQRAGMWSAAVLLAGAFRYLTLRPRVLWPLRLEAETIGLDAARVGGFREAEALLAIRRAGAYRKLEAWAESDADFDRAMTLGHELRNIVRICDALCGRGLNELSQGRYPAALDSYRAALPLARCTGDARLEAVVECNLSAIRIRLGDYLDGLRHAERELVLRRRAQDKPGEAYAWYGISVARLRLGDPRTALAAGQRAVKMFREVRAQERDIARAAETLADAHTELGELEHAMRALRTARSIMVHFGDPRADEVSLRLERMEAGATPLD
ncbi:tetratricopeptide repeat protein [Actinokineospora globicatena]|nr:tetratricopeptide repeat protein [Actinokineospora globicatena]